MGSSIGILSSSHSTITNILCIHRVTQRIWKSHWTLTTTPDFISPQTPSDSTTKCTANMHRTTPTRRPIIYCLTTTTLRCITGKMSICSSSLQCDGNKLCIHKPCTYRAGQPGYANRSDSTSESKYSTIVTVDDVEDAEECAMYCTRNRGIIDDQLGTRCVSFNYHSLSYCILVQLKSDDRFCCIH